MIILIRGLATLLSISVKHRRVGTRLVSPMVTCMGQDQGTLSSSLSRWSTGEKDGRWLSQEVPGSLVLAAVPMKARHVHTRVQEQIEWLCRLRGASDYPQDCE